MTSGAAGNGVPVNAEIKVMPPMQINNKRGIVTMRNGRKFCFSEDEVAIVTRCP